jgi:hypothetical protein
VNSIPEEKRRSAAHCSRIGCVDKEEAKNVWVPDVYTAET